MHVEGLDAKAISEWWTGLHQRPSRARILVVDDEPGIISEFINVLGEGAGTFSEVKALLELEGELFGTPAGRAGEYFELCLCKQGDEAVEAVRESIDSGRPFSVAFIDIRMPPGIDGVAASECIRRLDPFLNIVLVTGFSDVGWSEIAERVPPADKLLYCHKPLHASEVRQFAHALSTKWFTEMNLQRAQARLRQILIAAPIVVYSRLAHGAHEVIYVSDNVRERFGHDPLRVVSEPGYWSRLVHPDDLARVEDALRCVMDEGDCSAEYRIRDGAGEYRWVSDRMTVLPHGLGRPKEIVGILTDVTDRREAEEKMRYLAYFDGLTGLPNRELMKQMLDRALASAARYQRRVAILFLDVDHFKRINDTLGHHAGDTVLREVAKRLLSCIRRSDAIFQEAAAAAAERVAPSGSSSGEFSPEQGGNRDVNEADEYLSRHGGDEFVAILSDIESSEDAASVARRMIEALARPIALPTGDLGLTVSIGISVYPTDASDAAGLLKNADAAMYQAKEQGRNRFTFYRDEP